MIVQQFFVKGLAHSSYLLGGTKACAIVDPRRDVKIYLDAAEDMGMKITHVLETHLHADFASGHCELARETGARIVAPRAGESAFAHEAVSEGDSFEIEDMAIRVIETPGHTPEHVSYVVTDGARGKDPVGVFCGDTLFVGDVGRPDLFPGKAKELAGKLFDNLHGKLLMLPDFCEVYPAHGAGSLCGRAMGAKRTSAIGYERRYNAALLIKERDEFIRSLTTDMPPAPDHFSRLSAVNRKGPALLDTLPALEGVTPERFEKMADGRNAVVLDIRNYDAFGGQHVPGAYNIDFGGNFATFCGWLLPPDRELLLVAEDAAQACKAVIWLRRVGLDGARAYLEDGMFAWAAAGLPTRRVRQLSAEEFHAMSVGARPVSVVDVRAPGEYRKHHIRGAVNVPVADLRTRYGELDPKVPVALVCSTGRRSSLAASILLQHGFNEVWNLAGGMTGFSAAGYAPECPVCVAPHLPIFIGSRAA